MARFGIEEKITYLIESSALSLLNNISHKGDSTSSLDIRLDVPKDTRHGDLTANIAMRLTKSLRMNPMVIAEKLRDALTESFSKHHIAGAIERIDIVKPGFINFWLSKDFLHETLLSIKKKGKRYGSSTKGSRKKVQIEFVSANPTGPLTVAHGRQAAIGDALANILKFYGYRVTKEYFINDVGRQVDILGRSILYHYLQSYGKETEFPEDGYRGGYIREIANEIKHKRGNKFVNNSKQIGFFSSYGISYILGIIKKDLNEFGIHFDSWFSQRTLTQRKINRVLETLRGKGYIYNKEGATWFRSTTFGDEKDRVVVKSDGAFTYFAPDIAYHCDKYRRKFKRVINIWGPDHHGYIPRLKAAVQALGYSEDSIAILLVQLATLYRNGKMVSMSTRKGEFLALKEVLDEVGKDVTKFFFLMRKLDSHLDFDLEVAKHESSDNPVYYIQYAHARIWSIMGFSKKIKKRISSKRLKLSLLKEKEEQELMRLLCQFPAYVRDGASNLEPYYIIVYLNNLATIFHNFYTKHKVVSDNLDLSKARLFLVDCVRICLANGLRLLGVSLPKKM